MDSLGTATGAGVSVPFGGKTYFLSAPTLKDIGAIENHMIAERRRDRIKLVTDRWGEFPSEEEARRQLDRAYDDAASITSVSPEDIQRFMASNEGAAFTYWILMCRTIDPGITLEDVWDSMQEMEDEVVREMQNRISQASGVDQLKNSDTPALAGGKTEATEKAEVTEKETANA